MVAPASQKRGNGAMPLLEHQVALGRCLRARGADPFEPLAALREIGLDRAELAELNDLVHSSGFRFTRRGQRSWCEGRTGEMAQFTLSIYRWNSDGSLSTTGSMGAEVPPLIRRVKQRLSSNLSRAI